MRMRSTLRLAVLALRRSPVPAWPHLWQLQHLGIGLLAEDVAGGDARRHRPGGVAGLDSAKVQHRLPRRRQPHVLLHGVRLLHECWLLGSPVASVSTVMGLQRG